MNSLSDCVLTDEALTFMKSKLPQYVVDSLVAAGFDTLEVISLMDVSSNSDNSIDEVEKYVCSEHPEWLPNGRFPPGHRLRIRLFVEAVKKSLTSTENATENVRLGKTKRGCGCTDRKGKRARIDPRPPDNQASVYAITRRQIAKWQEQQTGELRELKEEKHFEVCVDLDSSNECAPFVVCLLCNRKCILGSKSDSVLISNWTRHVSKCIKKIGLRENQRKITLSCESASSGHASSPSPSPQSSNQLFLSNILPRHASTPLSSPPVLNTPPTDTQLCNETSAHLSTDISVCDYASQPVHNQLLPFFSGFDDPQPQPHFSTLSAKSPLSCTSMYTFSSTAASVPTLGQTNTCISSELPVTCSSSTCVFSTSASVPTSVVPEQTHFSPTYKSSSPNPTFMASATSSTYQVPFVRLPYQSAVTSQTPPTPVVLTSTSDSSISSHHLDISSSTFPPSTEAHSLPSSLKHPESERSFRLAPPVLRQEGN